MSKSKNDFLRVFIIFLIASFLIFLIFSQSFSTNIRSGLEIFLKNILIASSSLFPKVDEIFLSSYIKKLEKGNRELLQKFIYQESLKKENQALKDQFKTDQIKSYNLIPVKIIGMPNFVPGVSMPEEFIIDKGLKNNIKIGQAVIFKNMILGKIVRVSNNVSAVSLISNPSFSFAVKTLSLNKDEKEALGIVKGEGNGGIVLENVLLSEKIKPGDIVATKGDIDDKGIGYPADLIVGKVVSVNKKPSNLFQAAKLETLIDFSNLETVFVFSL